MPRPRVRIEDRQRAVKACIPCKSSKKRCDSKSPCSSCVRRNDEPGCVYEDVRPLMRRQSQAGPSQVSTLRRSEYSETFPTQRPSRNSSVSRQSVQYQPSKSGVVHDAAYTTGVCTNQTETAPLISGPGIRGPGHRGPINQFEVEPAVEKADSLPQSRLMLNANGEKGEITCWCV